MQELLHGLLILVVYFIILALSAFLLRYKTPVPDEVFRKLLHCILLGSLLVWTLVFSHWYLAALSALGFAAAVYPLLMLAERIPGFSAFITERKGGELKHSLMVVFTMYAAVVSVCWGLLDDKLLALCSIYAWGFGDAAAALVGKRFGRHGLTGRHIEGRKSVEGTLAMFCVSFVCVLALLLFRGGLGFGCCLAAALLTAAVSAIVELFTKNGMDTITCPLAAMAALLLTLWLIGGIHL